MERRRTVFGIAIGTLAIACGLALLIGARTKPLPKGAHASSVEHVNVQR